MQDKIIYRSDNKPEQWFLVDKDAVSGSLFWSIEGKNLQFTWFDVPANTNFPNHKHDSEQITYVLDGELFIESENSVYKLSTGDCILIPGNIDHKVWTESIPAKAVDAWSPVNKAYATNENLLNK